MKVITHRDSCASCQINLLGSGRRCNRMEHSGHDMKIKPFSEAVPITCSQFASRVELAYATIIITNASTPQRLNASTPQRLNGSLKALALFRLCFGD
jgi:hypothetical protein